MDDPTFDDGLEEDFQWPKIGDKLFAQGRPAYAAFLAHHADERFHHMTKGYKLAADLLVKQAEAEGWSKRRQLVYPIVFCYRHFLELTLKVMLEKYGPMANIAPNRSDHTLESLWTDFRRLLHNLDAEGGPEDKQTTDVIGQCVAEFAKIDPGSQTFRYPTCRKGHPFDLHFNMIDLLQLHETMQKIETYFMCVDGFLGQLKEAQENAAEMLAALYPTD
jgi:hypothetical protein